jgi:hypothetical protein
MPDAETKRRANRDKAEGKSSSTQAGEFVREEMHHIREGKHGARSTKQAIAIGLSKARRAGVGLPPPKRGRAPEKTRENARRDSRRGHAASAGAAPSEKRARAARRALEREGRGAASARALSRHAHWAASRRTARERSLSAKRAVRTKGPKARKAAAKKAARTRSAHEAG